MSLARAVPHTRSLLWPGLLFILAACNDRGEVEHLVRQHATAWETGNPEIMAEIIHEDAVLAYPTRRLGKAEWLADLAEFSVTNTDTRIYIHEIVVDGRDFAVEWQFATTDRGSGARTAVSDAIMGRVQEGQIVLWKEYLDGRVAKLQEEGALQIEEGAEPFPWPLPK